MNIAILAMASLSAVASVGALVIVGKLAYEMNATKTQIESDLEDVKGKVARNAKVFKAALSQMEL